MSTYPCPRDTQATANVAMYPQETNIMKNEKRDRALWVHWHVLLKHLFSFEAYEALTSTYKYCRWRSWAYGFLWPCLCAISDVSPSHLNISDISHQDASSGTTGKVPSAKQRALQSLLDMKKSGELQLLAEAAAAKILSFFSGSAIFFCRQGQGRVYDL